MRKIYLFIISIMFLTMWGCGKVPVEIDESTFEPKIVVEGYLYPGQTPKNIILTRNFALNTEINLSEFYIMDADVSITDMESDQTYLLKYNPFTFSYEYAGNDFIIDYDKSYRINLKATIDGKALTATSITTTPGNGFEIDESASILGTQQYDQAVDADTKFMLQFKRSPTIDSYITSITALDASFDTFIDNNVLGISKEDFADTTDTDELKFYNFIKNQSQWTQTRKGGGDDLSGTDIEWYSTWFYGRYRVIMYCADVNMTEYFLTHKQIMEIDGNLLEPKFHFNGDAIGVFGSAVMDTVYFEITE